jgi:hypothetical protein
MEQDIESYITSQVDYSPDFMGWRSDLRDMIKAELVARANGV